MGGRERRKTVNDNKNGTKWEKQNKWTRKKEIYPENTILYLCIRCHVYTWFGESRRNRGKMNKTSERTHDEQDTVIERIDSNDREKNGWKKESLQEWTNWKWSEFDVRGKWKWEKNAKTHKQSSIDITRIQTHPECVGSTHTHPYEKSIHMHDSTNQIIYGKRSGKEMGRKIIALKHSIYCEMWHVQNNVFLVITLHTYYFLLLWHLHFAPSLTSTSPPVAARWLSYYKIKTRQLIFTRNWKLKRAARLSALETQIRTENHECYNTSISAFLICFKSQIRQKLVRNEFYTPHFHPPLSSVSLSLSLYPASLSLFGSNLFGSSLYFSHFLRIDLCDVFHSIWEVSKCAVYACMFAFCVYCMFIISISIYQDRNCVLVSARIEIGRDVWQKSDRPFHFICVRLCYCCSLTTISIGWTKRIKCEMYSTLTL